MASVISSLHFYISQQMEKLHCESEKKQKWFLNKHEASVIFDFSKKKQMLNKKHVPNKRKKYYETIIITTTRFSHGLCFYNNYEEN